MASCLGALQGKRKQAGKGGLRRTSRGRGWARGAGRPAGEALESPVVPAGWRRELGLPP